MQVRLNSARRKRSFGRTLGAALVAACLSVGAAAHAAIITYAPPTIVGTNVTYPQVSESSNSATLPLYGAPQISGNDLLFRNMNFAATSVGGSPATAFVDGQINFTLTANSGSTLQSLVLSEFGDYNVSATPANPAAVNYVKVYQQALQITVLAVGGVPLATPLVDNTSVVMSVSPSGGDYQTGVDPSTGSWSGLANANLASLFGRSNITSISVSFDNQLLAQSQVGGIGTISKKGLTIDPILTPEPTMLALAGFAGLLMMRKRA